MIPFIYCLGSASLSDLLIPERIKLVIPRQEVTIPHIPKPSPPLPRKLLDAPNKFPSELQILIERLESLKLIQFFLMSFIFFFSNFAYITTNPAPPYPHPFSIDNQDLLSLGHVAEASPPPTPLVRPSSPSFLPSSTPTPSAAAAVSLHPKP